MYPAKQAETAIAGKVDVPTVTLRENLTLQLTLARNRVKELEEAQARLEKSGLLDTRIDDLQKAMRW